MLFKNYPIPRQATSQIKQRLLKQLHKPFLTNGVFQLFVQATYFLPIPRQTALHGFNKILMKPFIRILFGFFFQQELVFLLLVQKQLLRLVKQLMKSFNLFPFISNCSWRYRKLVSDLVSDFWFPFSPVSLLPVDFDGISETIFLVSDFGFRYRS